MSADRQAEALPDDQVELAVEVFRMLADGTRVRLLWALVDAELSVNDLAAAVGKPGPAVSQHLAKLRMARLVRTRREGNQVFYRLENDHVARLVLDAVHNAEHATDGVPTHHRGGATPTRAENAPMTARHDHDRDDHEGTTTTTTTTDTSDGTVGSVGTVRPHSHDAADSIDAALASVERGIRAVKISLVALAVHGRLAARSSSPSPVRWRCSPTRSTTSPTP